MRASDWVNLLNGPANCLAQATDSPILSTPLPFVADTTLGDALDFVTGFAGQILDTVRDPADGSPRFAAVRDDSAAWSGARIGFR